MKTIGIIGAMEEEVINIKSQIDIISAKNIVGLDFYMGKMAGNNVVLVRCGIGKVNAAVCTQVLIDLYAVDYIINVGVAGAISKELEIGDIVISSDVVHHDFDTTVFGDKMGVIPRMDESFFKADEEIIKIALKAVENENNVKAHVGRIASGDQFISSSEAKNRIWNTFKALCAEMEGAAIAQASYLNKIPFVIIRSISDKAEEGTSVNYEQFFKKSAETASRIVKHMIDIM